MAAFAIGDMIETGNVIDDYFQQLKLDVVQRKTLEVMVMKTDHCLYFVFEFRPPELKDSHENVVNVGMSQLYLNFHED